MESDNKVMRIAALHSRWLRAVVVLGLGWAVMLPASSAANTIVVPAPTGVYKVGTTVVRMVGETDSQHLANAGPRELLVRVWYPTYIRQGCRPAPYADPYVWAYISQIAGLELPQVRTNSCQNAPVMNRAFPVIVLTHGYTGMFTDYTFLSEDLASRGYLVVSIGHTYESTAVQFPGGRLVTSVFGSQFSRAGVRDDLRSVRLARSMRLADLKFVLDELTRLNTIGRLAGSLDLTRIAVIGHSLGGEVAMSMLERDARLKAAVALDADFSAASAMGTSSPVLLLTAGRQQWRTRECELWRNLSGPRLFVNLRGAEHLALSDALWLKKAVPQLNARSGAMPMETTISAIREYVAAFLDANLRHEPRRSLLNGASPRFTGAAVTGQNQALCGEVVSR
ncbi:MAG TPA: alpha/beta fold hydrolase [Terriglobales bacterium]|nr:alpha/beta fold hydrolase [Terriglobales bacterium]